MEIVDLFLNALQTNISPSSSKIIDYENTRNSKMQIKNILYTHEILNDEIKLEDLVSFSDAEIETLFSALDSEKKDILFKTYNVYKPLFEMYQKIKNKFEGDFEAPQYNEASKWLNDIVYKINRYLKINNAPSDEFINSLKERNALYTKYYSLFNGNVLVKPVDDFQEFNDLLDELNFNDNEKYEIKKFIGIGHIKLLTKKQDDNKELDKYKVIIKSKKEKYQETYELLSKEEGLDIDNANINDLTNKYNKDENEIRQSLTIIFMEDVIDKVKNNKLDLNSAILELDNILEFSRKNREEVVQEKIVVNSEEQEIINEANEILNNEKDLINSINDEEFSKYLAQSINTEGEESIKYQIVSLLLALHGELEKYNNIKDIDKLKDMVVNNIKDYIEAYKTLKSKLNN